MPVRASHKVFPPDLQENRMPPMSAALPTGPGHSGPVPTNQLATNLPFLRRYARAATGSRKAGDALVCATLETALADPAALDRMASSATGLFAAFSVLWNTVDPQSAQSTDVVDQPGGSQLGRMPPLRRQALLLNQLEEFSLGQTAEILNISEAEAAALVAAARDDITREPVVRVLIIEDEPTIANYLEDIVRLGGHEIVGKAATASEALAAFQQYHPNLILSDVQLADGSSGIDVVDAMQHTSPVQVIFITAFPQKFLTGGGREPAFMITKPFREETVRTTISQTLFFGGGDG